MNRRTQLASALLISAVATCLALIANARVFRSTTRLSPSHSVRLVTLPNLVFWAWERPEDLRFIDPSHTAVAFLAKTITLTTVPSIYSRLQPLRVAPGTPLIAVVRIENPRNRTSQAPAPPISAELRAQLATQIASLQSMPAVRGIQIDFDATTSERAFYSDLLQDVRRQLRPELPLSITALASWCMGDSWLNDLPSGTIDEAVPMLFRMGANSADVTNFLRTDQPFRADACNASLGLSTDEAFSRSILTGESPASLRLRAEKRIYVFAPHPWTERETNSILQELHP